ncbi:MAG: chloride channel protein [Proteobacteria bacterium]|nr:MAG: chloride channel protein [Pseudomonadota bacterium]
MLGLRESINNQFDQLRLRLANPEAIMLMSLLAVATGVLTGLIIVAFRMLLDFAQSYLATSGQADDFESLAPSMRFILPMLGAVILGGIFHYLAPQKRQVGILHVIERMQYHQGRMPWVNMLVQFTGAALAILSGYSVGREGPNVHMGAYSGSWVAQNLELPNNSTRTLVACGTAAAIGASFNTPLAGIIFAMEVILQQYTVQGFVPIILSAVTGTYTSLAFLEGELFFQVELSTTVMGYDWSLVVLLGICIGILSALFNTLLLHITRLTSPWPVWWRFLLAGLLMGLLGWWMPQSMGIGYDTVQQVMDASLGLELLGWILLAKFMATVISLGLGMPGGVIGPLMFIGSIAGGAWVVLIYSSHIPVLIPTEPRMYPVLGMGAMFAASLQAPLAGLTAVMELAGHAGIILPGMLAIVSASLTNKVIFRHDSLFLSLLWARGLDHSSSPVMQRLRMIGAASLMNRSFHLCENMLSRETAEFLVNRNFQWLLITDSDRMPREMVRSLDVQSFMEEHPEAEKVVLTEIPGKRLQLAAISVRASLQDALDEAIKTGAEALYLHRKPGGHIYGLITRERIEKAYH